MSVSASPAIKGPACLPAGHLSTRLNGRRVTVAGLVILRQRPGTAKGVIFLTLEDETGIVNVIVWRALYERFRRAVIAGRCLRVTGRLQCESGVMHLIAERIEDISPLLDTLLAPEFARAGGSRQRHPENASFSGSFSASENAASRQPVAAQGTGGNAALPPTGQTG